MPYPITAFKQLPLRTTSRKDGIRIPNDKHFPELAAEAENF
jgi:hypothetical protein